MQIFIDINGNNGMVIVAVGNIVPFCQLLFRVFTQPCCMYYNSYSFQVSKF